MKIKIAVLSAMLAVLILAGGAFAYRMNNMLNDRPSVGLFSPVTDNIDLSGKTNLEFKWRRINLTQTDHYRFKIYSGYNMLESTLILKQDVGVNQYPVTIPAKTFGLNQTYTWSLVQVYVDGSKSDNSSSPFTIIKK